MMKRLFDIILFIIIFPLAIFFIFIISILVYLNIGFPIFYIQTRVGKNNKLFKLIKFRTMKNFAQKNDKKINENQRLTRLTKFLRSTSLDEIPELWNVIKGDMSFVGPRPLLEEYIPLYNNEQKRRHNVKPGITGWAQINGRNEISWQEKFKFDIWYIDNYSFLLDLKILWKTIIKVIKREGISAETELSMKKFTGNKFEK